jgi:hypothetical protein
MRKRIPVTMNSARRFIYDQYGIQLFVGDKIRYQYCSGRYGQTQIAETVLEKDHYEYGMVDSATFHWNFAQERMIGYSNHNDFEHGHETWVRVIGNTPFSSSQNFEV